MKVQEINDILAAGQLAPLSREQLLVIANSPAKARFHTALLAQRDGVDQSLVLDQLIRECVQPVAGVSGQGSRPSATPAAAPYYSFHVYGKQAALTISEAKTRAAGVATIQIEAAGALGDGSRRTYDWANKVIVQFSDQELTLAIALFEGKINRLDFKGHGQRNEKFVSLEFQGGNFVVGVGARGGTKHLVPVGAADAIKIVSLGYRQMKTNAPHLDMAMLREMIGQVATMHMFGNGK